MANQNFTKTNLLVQNYAKFCISCTRKAKCHPNSEHFDFLILDGSAFKWSVWSQMFGFRMAVSLEYFIKRIFLCALTRPNIMVLQHRIWVFNIELGLDLGTSALEIASTTNLESGPWFAKVCIKYREQNHWFGPMTSASPLCHYLNTKPVSYSDPHFHELGWIGNRSLTCRANSLVGERTRTLGPPRWPLGTGCGWKNNWY